TLLRWRGPRPLRLPTGLPSCRVQRGLRAATDHDHAQRGVYGLRRRKGGRYFRIEDDGDGLSLEPRIVLVRTSLGVIEPVLWPQLVRILRGRVSRLLLHSRGVREALPTSH